MNVDIRTCGKIENGYFINGKLVVIDKFFDFCEHSFSDIERELINFIIDYNEKR